MPQALIISDTHRLVEPVAHIARSRKFDIGFHCGDFCVDESLYPFHKMHLVKGNNDFESQAPLDQVVTWQGLRIFMAHGHTYRVDLSLVKLDYRAREVGADVVLYGHTHYPVCEKMNDIIFVNPGSLKQPRGFPVPTFVVCAVKKRGQDKLVRFTYYDDQLHKVNELSRTFTV